MKNMSGPIPIEVTNSSSLRTLFLEGTRICVPESDQFNEWLADLEVVRADRCARATGSMVYLTQAVQSLDYPVPLVAGEDALLRVFVVAGGHIEADMPPLRATFFLDGTEIHAVDIAGQETMIPSEIDEGSLSASANTIIPGSVIVPGLELVIEIDPDSTLDPSLSIQSRIPETDRLSIDVRDVQDLDLTVVPLIWSKEPDHSVVMETEGLTREDDLFRPIRDLLPVSDFSVNIREPVFTSVDPTFSNHGDILRHLEAIRVMDGSNSYYSYYMGVLRGAGGATFPNTKVFVSRLHDGTIVHELGHTMGLGHAPCGGAGTDPRYPYDDGSIGAWGYDIVENKLITPDTPDLMSYCLEDFWISDYHFRRALINRVREAGSQPVSMGAVASRSLLVWGGVNKSGELIIEPSFVVDAPTSYPGSDGPYRLTGEDADGNSLFTLGFAMSKIADGDGGGFAFTIPVQQVWSSQLARITLSGPEGFVEMTRESGRSAALLLDQSTGQVRGILRDWPEPGTTVQAARRAVPELGLDVVVSPGIPDSADW